jgi:hypothetical protein
MMGILKYIIPKRLGIWTSGVVVECNGKRFIYMLFSRGIQLFQLRLSTSKAEKSNTSAKGCRESLWKFINLLAIPSSLSRSYLTFPLVFDFSALLVDNLNWNSCMYSMQPYPNRSLACGSSWCSSYLEIIDIIIYLIKRFMVCDWLIANCEIVISVFK